MIWMHVYDPDPEKEVVMSWYDYMEAEEAIWAEEDLCPLNDDDLDPARDEALRLALEEGRLDGHLHYLDQLALGLIRDFEVVR